MIQLGSEAPVMALDGNGHLMLSDNGDLRTALLQNLRCEEETELPVAFRDLGLGAVSAVADVQSERPLHATVRRRRVRDQHHARSAQQMLRRGAGGGVERGGQRRLRGEGGER